MKDNFLKSWKTTLIGVVILGMYIYSIVSGKQEFDIANISQMLQLLVSFGFMFGKDGDKSHSINSAQDGIDAPDPKKEEK